MVNFLSKSTTKNKNSDAERYEKEFSNVLVNFNVNN
jgi:hypothetical protein